MLQFISDIHLEFYKKVKFNQFIIPSAPYLAILGDLGYPHEDHFNDFLKHSSHHYKKVFLISGNHEYYSQKYTINEINSQLVKVCQQYDNVFYLNNNEHLLNESTVILGTTLWTHVPESKKHKIKNSINDYLKIYVQTAHFKSNMTVDLTNQLHNHSLQWLTNKILEYQDKNIIILTHHLPSFKLIDSKYEGSDINYAFASSLDDLMLNNNHIKYWLCGHTHHCMNVKINQCQCITNPLGYPGENDILDEQKIKCIE